MITKRTTNQSYPKPDASNFLQDDVNQIESALDMIDTDIHAIKQEQTNLAASKVDRTELDNQLATLTQKVYSTAYEIIGPPLAFQYAKDLTYSIGIPDATTFVWTATGVTITSGAAGKTITVKTSNTSGSVSVTVTTAAGDTIQKTKSITVNQFSNIQTFNYTGNIESWTVPANVELIKIETWGAMGGDGYYNKVFVHPGGKGARMKGEFQVTPGDKLLILVGGKGKPQASSNTYSVACGGGGGGTFVVKVDPNSSYQMTVSNMDKVTPLIIAGGGGGGGTNQGGQNFDGGHGVVEPNGGIAVAAISGNNGNCGETSSHGAGGAGFKQCYTWTTTAYVHAKSFLDGGTGGIGLINSKMEGGFGGGGGASITAGGAGGYSGGGTGGNYNTPTPGGAAGGGSYNTGMNQNNSPGAREGDGKVEISW